MLSFPFTFPSCLAPKSRFGSAVSPPGIGPSCLFFSSFLSIICSGRSAASTSSFRCRPSWRPDLLPALDYYYLISTSVYASVAAFNSAPMDSLWACCLAVADSAPPLVPLWCVLSGTPLTPPWWTGRDVMEFPPPGGRVLFYCVSFGPWTLYIAEVSTLGSSATHSSKQELLCRRPPAGFFSRGRIVPSGWLSRMRCFLRSSPPFSLFSPSSLPLSFVASSAVFLMGRRLSCACRGAHQMFRPWNSLLYFRLRKHSVLR
jgi:hypothetical protein